MNDLGQIVSTWIAEHGLRVVVALVLLVAAWVVSAWLRRWIIRSAGRAQFDLTLTKFLAGAARWTLLILVGLSALSAFGIETTSFAAIIAASGIAIGLAFQGTLSSLAAGIMLLVFRPFKVGDVIRTASEIGTVDEISLFTTKLDTFDKRRIIVPNNTVVSGTIENISHHPIRRTDVAVGTDYGADLDRTREVLETAVNGIPGRLDDPPPQVLLTGLGESSVDWEVRVWAPASDLLTIKQATIRAVKVALDEAGIGIPFPQRDVHMDQP